MPLGESVHVKLPATPFALVLEDDVWVLVDEGVTEDDLSNALQPGVVALATGSRGAPAIGQNPLLTSPIITNRLRGFAHSRVRS